jgi:hypothetical protein
MLARGRNIAPLPYQTDSMILGELRGGAYIMKVVRKHGGNSIVVADAFRRPL